MIGSLSSSGNVFVWPFTSENPQFYSSKVKSRSIVYYLASSRCELCRFQGKRSFKGQPGGQFRVIRIIILSSNRSIRKYFNPRKLSVCSPKFNSRTWTEPVLLWNRPNSSNNPGLVTTVTLLSQQCWHKRVCRKTTILMGGPTRRTDRSSGLVREPVTVDLFLVDGPLRTRFTKWTFLPLIIIDKGR